MSLKFEILNRLNLLTGEIKDAQASEIKGKTKKQIKEYYWHKAQWILNKKKSVRIEKKSSRL